MDPLPAILNVLDAGAVPPSATLKTTDIEPFSHGLRALMDLSTVLRCLHLDYDPPNIDQLRTRASKLLVGRWEHVIEWLQFHLVHAYSVSNSSDILRLCTDIITLTSCTCGYEDTCEWKAGLIRHPLTIDFVLALLCQVDPHTDAYSFVPKPHGCAILTLFDKCLQNPTSRADFVERLQTVDASTASDVVRSLVGRAQQLTEENVVNELVSDASDERVWFTLQSLAFLTESTRILLWDMKLRKLFLKHNFILKWAHTLFRLCTKALALDWNAVDTSRRDKFWTLCGDLVGMFVKTLVVSSTPKPRSSMRSAIRAGIVHATLCCLSKIDGDSDDASQTVRYALANCAAFLTVREVFATLRNCICDAHGVPGLRYMELLEAVSKNGQAGKVAHAMMQRAIDRGLKTFDEHSSMGRRTSVQMCANRKVR